VNHWWHVALHVTSEGFTLSVPCDRRSSPMTFRPLWHPMLLHTSDKRSESFAARPMTVASSTSASRPPREARRERSQTLARPVEVSDATPFTRDRHPCAYDRLRVDEVPIARSSASIASSRFIAAVRREISPVHFFWAPSTSRSRDFSGGPTRSPEGSVMREAYSHEGSATASGRGDWLGQTVSRSPIFYAYAVPEPEGLRRAKVQPPAARYD